MSGSTGALRYRPAIRLVAGFCAIVCGSMAMLYFDAIPEKRRVGIVWAVAGLIWLARWLLMVFRPYLELGASSFTVQGFLPVTLERTAVLGVEPAGGIVRIESRPVARLTVRLDRLSASDRSTARAYFEELADEVSSRPEDGERLGA